MVEEALDVGEQIVLDVLELDALVVGDVAQVALDGEGF